MPPAAAGVDGEAIRVTAQDVKPLDQAAASEEEQLIWTAVAQLEPRQAMAVELHYRRGFAVEEIAAVMECPEGTIKTLLFRARERLRQRLARRFNEAERTPS